MAKQDGPALSRYATTKEDRSVEKLKRLLPPFEFFDIAAAEKSSSSKLK